MRRTWSVGVVALILLAAPAAAEDRQAENRKYRVSFALRTVMPVIGQDPLGLQVGIDRSFWAPSRWLRARAGLQLAWLPLIGVPADHRTLDADGTLLDEQHLRVVDLRLMGVGELSIGAEHARLQLGLLLLMGPQLYYRKEQLFERRLGIDVDYQHTELVLDGGVGLTLRGRITPAIGAQLGFVYDVIDFPKSYTQLSVYYAF